MNSKTKLVALFAIIALMAFGAVLRQPTFPSDITAFLPVDSKSSDLVRRVATSGLSRRVVILLEGEDTDEAGAVAARMAADLGKARDLFADASAGPEENLSAVHELYFPHRYSFVAPTAPQLEVLQTDAGMRFAAQQFVKGMQGRHASMLHRLGPRDPLLSYPAILDRLSALDDAGISIVDGQYRTAESDAIVFVELVDSPLASEYAMAVQSTIDSAFTEARGDSQTTMTVSGMHNYTVVIASMIKADIQRVTAVSLLGLLFVFGFVFGRIRAAALPLLSIGIGVGTAFATTAAILGSVHLLTIAFGASLIGVCVDYSLHYLNHRDHDDDVWRAVFTAAATTVGGFAVLFTSSVHVLHQIGMFACVGVVTAVISARLLAATAFPPRSAGPRHRTAIALVERGAMAVRERTAMGLLAAAPVLFGLAGLPDLTIEQDMSGISHPSPSLRDADERVQQKVGGVRSSNFVVVQGIDVADALQRNDALAIELHAAQSNDVVSHFSSMHGMLWSPATQQMNRAFFADNAAALKERMAAAFGDVGVRPEMLEPISKGFELADTDLTLEQVRASSLGAIADLFDPEGEGRLLLTYLGDVRDPDALQQHVDKVGAFWLSQRQALDDAWHTLGREVVRAAGLGLVAIIVVAMLAYRDPRTVAFALAPAIFACVCAVGLLSMLGYAIGPIHGLGLLLVIAIGADYGVMLQAHHDRPGPLMLGVLMAYATTMCSFGALSLSRHPVLHAFGLTIAVGVTFALLLLPALDWASNRRTAAKT